MLSHNIYYLLKPFIPRRSQISLRRAWIRQKRKRHANIWPIDERAARRPEGWAGWPEGKPFALVLTHDVESSKGVERCVKLAKLEERLGFRSSFNFVAEDYNIPQEVFDYLKDKGFEIGVHGINHNGNIFQSYSHFRKQAPKIDEYLTKWGAVGFRAPSMYHNLNWVGELNIEYDSSTFDTDPFEPQPDGVGTIFPFWVSRNRELATRNSDPVTGLHSGYVELPYTLPQDFTLFILMKEKNTDIWAKKLNWIVEFGGMVLLNTHPDYINFDGGKNKLGEYPKEYYEDFLAQINLKYKGQYWHILPKDLARYWARNFSNIAENA